MPDLYQRARSLHGRLFPPLEVPERPPVRLTRQARAVLLVFLSGSPDLSALVIYRATRVPLGTIGLVLADLERAGWVTFTPAATTAGMPAGSRRGAYAITTAGRQQAYELLGLEAPE